MSSASVSMGPVERIGERVLEVVANVGNVTEFTTRTLAWLFTRLPKRETLLPVFYQIGVRSVPVVALTGMFIGMVMAVQMHGQFRRWHLESQQGSVINISLVKELGPVLAATMIAGRVGSALAAELGTMRITEQIDALWTLGANPIHYLVVPRFLACVLLTPLLTVMADFMGVVGGDVISTMMLHIDRHQYWSHSQDYVETWDIMSGLFKSLFFGAAIAIISCHRGFNSRAGAEGVGRAATEAFVYSFIAILVLDFFLGITLKATYERLWPIHAGA